MTTDIRDRIRTKNIKPAERQEIDSHTRRMQQVNVGQTERQLSLAAGGFLVVAGLVRRNLPGLLAAGIGGGLLYRGATGHCRAYDALGINTASRTREELNRDLEQGVEVVESFLIDRPKDELYSFWRDLENLPKIMAHLKAVESIDDKRSRWIAKAPAVAGGSVEWEAEIVDEIPNSRISWRSLPGADVQNEGSIEFKSAPGNRGTAVRVAMKYAPPAGAIGQWIAKLFGSNPETLLREDLRNFKRFMEIGDVLTTEGQPRGSCFAGIGRLMN
jgi:uncharacterized membrane protein